jgi:hypothetical protein
MGIRTFLNSRFGAVATGSVAIALLSASAGYTAGEIGSRDIADDSVRSVDIKDGTVRDVDLSQPAQPVQHYWGSNWSIVDRNVIGNGDSYLRAGPDGAPYGEGSLGIRTGSPEDKAAFGNQVNFAGDPLAGISTVSYSVYTTRENNARYAENGPSVTFEIDPTGQGDTTTPNYSSLVYVPEAAADNEWTKLEASSADRWFLTGAAGTSSGCTQATYCTLDEVKAKYANATLLTAQITKGRDYAFSGAVDGLQINDVVYDFEPTGVTQAAPAG